MAAGFFLFRKIDLKNPDVSILKKYCFRILGLWGIWSILLVTVNDYQMWYMTALVVATLIVGALIVCKVKMRYIGIMSVLLYAMGLLGDSYYGFVGWFKQYEARDFLIVNYEKYFYHTRNGVFMGVIFVFMGALCAKKKIVMDMKVAVVLEWLSRRGKFAWIKWLY